MRSRIAVVRHLLEVSPAEQGRAKAQERKQKADRDPAQVRKDSKASEDERVLSHLDGK